MVLLKFNRRVIAYIRNASARASAKAADVLTVAFYLRKKNPSKENPLKLNDQD